MTDTATLPSEERPWEKRYEASVLSQDVPHASLYRALLDENADNMDATAFVMACRDDSEMTYGEFIALTDSVAKSLMAMGVRPDSQVAATFKNAVEGLALVFAKSRIGALVHLIDPTNNPHEIRRMLDEAEAGVLFIASEFASSLVGHVSGSNVETVVVLPSDSGEQPPQPPAADGVNVLDWASFLSLGENVQLPPAHEPTSEEGSIVVYTGGSTGRSKGVVLSDYCFVSKYYRCIWSNWKWGRGRLALCVLPATIAFGLSEGFVSSLLAGETHVIADCYAMPRFAEFILRYRPNDVACSPVHMQYLVNSPLIEDDTDLSFLEMFPCGGDGMTLAADEHVRAFLESHGAPDAFAQGCGFTETAGAFCYGQADRNKPGGMGIPLAGNTCGVFDLETGKELGYGQSGEWAVRTDTAMLGYFGSASSQNAKALRTHADGSTWLHPGDIVHMDEDGVIFMHDRVSRTFNVDGLKVYPSALESIMSGHPAVSKCVVSGVRLAEADRIAITDQKVPIANIALEPGNEGNERAIAEELSAMLADQAQTYISMAGFVFRLQIPITSRGKVNYQLLENEALAEGEGKAVVRIAER